MSGSPSEGSSRIWPDFIVLHRTAPHNGKWHPIGNKSAVDRLDDPAMRVDLLQSGSRQEKCGQGQEGASP